MAFRTVERKPQTSLLLDHFRARPNDPSISSIEAQSMYRIRSLSRRINDLEAAGHKFVRSHRVDPTGQRYVRYTKIGAAA